ncbi:DEAD/DEAH box helicase family protein [Spirillospora sp. NBC_00431]
MTDKVIENPIINSPYSAPDRHFKFDREGITNEILDGRRPSEYFIPVPRPRKRGGQLEFAELTADEIQENRQVNQIRARVDRWRELGFPYVEPTTLRLLEYWSAPDRDNKILFCQREAVETAVYLAEAARDDGQVWIRNELDEYNRQHNDGLNRVALKMATGSGKTVVMAMLIAWQTLNHVAGSKRGRYAKRFLVVAPGITIRDRLRVLLPEEDENYYRMRDLVPADLYGDLTQAKIVITNFHTLRRRETKQGKGISAFTKSMLGASFQETWGQMVTRVTRELGGSSEIVVLNDEAHHCYRGRAEPEADAETEATLKGEEKQEAASRNREARVWFSGLRAIEGKLGIKTVYDLSATPFFLSGSGYKEGTLFPWVVSDFSLVDAIESGIVKVPRVPVDDDRQSDDVTYLRLWDHIGASLPRKSRKDTKGTRLDLPPLLETALQSLYGSYEKAYRHWETSDAAREGEPPPVFIVVCNNTTVSKMVYDYIAGWEEGEGDGRHFQAGRLALFSNVDTDVTGGRWRARPRTILVDSEQLESGEAMSTDFKQIAAGEIEAFKDEYRRRYPGRSVDDIDDSALLREVMNTVGKRGKLGEQVRCVVSVSMLTEGWDANTVTHILGVRAFGTQLLCEQVVGRGLRRRSYAVDETGHFTPEYADVYGVPFQFIPTVGKTKDVTLKPTHRVKAEEDRAHLRITFPKLVGYRIELPDEDLYAKFGPDSLFRLTRADVPLQTVSAPVAGEVEEHELDRMRNARPQQIAYHIADRVVKQYLKDDEGTIKPWYFPQILDITRQWMVECLTCEGGTFPGLLMVESNTDIAARKIFHESIQGQGGRHARILPMLRSYDREGSTDDVSFFTTKHVYPTAEERCHVNYVVLDGPSGNSWEEHTAKVLEAIPSVASYVKNDHLGFAIPYAIGGRNHQYLPDFLVRLKESDDGVPRTLIVEVSGSHKPVDPTQEKARAARGRWVPAVNNHGGFGQWNYCEITDPRTARTQIEGAITWLYETKVTKAVSEMEEDPA